MADIFDAYDDACFRYGIAGKCGRECPAYGLRDCCDGLDEEEEEDGE